MNEYGTDIDIDADTKSYFARVFQWMWLALVISGWIARYVSQTPQILNLVYGNNIYFWIIWIAQLWLVRYLSSNITNLSLTGAGILFVLYSGLNGLLFSYIFIIFQLSSIVAVFGASAGIFLIMWIYGYTTNSDLTKLWSLFFMGLIWVIIGSLINIFLKNQLFDYIITILSVVIFVWLTAYDIQKLKNMNTKWDIWTDNESKEAIVWALQLYLDFINIFLNLLRLFGKRK